MSSASDNRHARKRQQTTNRLVEVAFDLFATHGYAQVTMEQIAATADVAKGTLYNHFPVKEAFLAHRFHADLAVAMQGVLAENEALPGGVVRLQALLHGVAANVERHREYMAPYLHYRLSQPVDTQEHIKRSGLDPIYSRLLAEGRAAGEIRTDLPIGLMVDTLSFMQLCTILRWLNASETSLAAEFDAMLDLFLTGARSGRTPA